jgi:hypothetical protein
MATMGIRSRRGATLRRSGHVIPAGCMSARTLLCCRLAYVILIDRGEDFPDLLFSFRMSRLLHPQVSLASLLPTPERPARSKGLAAAGALRADASTRLLLPSLVEGFCPAVGRRFPGLAQGYAGSAERPSKTYVSGRSHRLALARSPSGAKSISYCFRSD